jgi:hypothetical protein
MLLGKTMVMFIHSNAQRTDIKKAERFSLQTGGSPEYISNNSYLNGYKSHRVVNIIQL